MDTNLSLIVAPAHLIGVRETLRDWQVSGLVSDFIWIPVEAQDMGRNLNAQLVSQGALKPVDVRYLSGQVQYSRIGVLVLGAVTGAEQDAERLAKTGKVGSFVRDVITQDFGAAHVSAIRAVFATEHTSNKVELPDSNGWVDVVLSPSDSKGPRVGSRPVNSANIAEVCAFLASQVAPLAGMWDSVPNGTVDDLQPAYQGYRGRLVRSFFRRLDGTAVEDALRDKAFETASGYPLPNHQGAPSRYFEDDGVVVDQALQDFWAKHGYLVTPDREQYVAPEPKPISAGEALKMFGAFLGNAIKGTPGALASGLVDSTKAAVAQTVHGLVFGDRASEYNVVVGGIDASGRPVGWQESMNAAQRIEGALGVDRHNIDMSGVWRSMVYSSLTLLDYGTHDRDLPPRTPQPTIVRDPAVVAPDPEDIFTLKGSVAGRLGAMSVQPADLVHAQEVGRQIKMVAQDPDMQTPDADAQLNDMTDWYDRSRRSFVSRIGEAISSNFEARRQEIAERMKNLGRNTDEEDDSEHLLAEAHRILSAKLRQLFGYSAALTVLMFFLAGMDWAPWWLAWTVFGISLVGSVAGAFGLFMRTQTDIFQVIHRRKKDREDQEIDVRNLKATISEFTRLGEAYSQYLRWADIVGAFVHRPFGSRTQLVRGEQRRFDDLPISMGSAEYVVDYAQVEETARMLRTEVFYTGWTSDQFRNFLNVSLQRAGINNFPLSADMHSLFAEQSTADDSVLTVLALSLRNNGVDPALEAGYWEQMRHSLDHPGMEATRRALLSQIHISGEHASQSLEDFRGTVGLEDNQEIRETLDDELLTANAVGYDKHAVIANSVRKQPAGFGEVLVHTQITGDLTPDDLEFAQSYSGDVNWGNSEWSISEPAQNAQPAQNEQPSTWNNPFGGDAI